MAVPSQDMVLGIYYLTQERPGAKGEGMFFKNLNEAILAYENGYITLHSKIKVRVSKTMADGSIKSGIIDVTLGRMLFNEIMSNVLALGLHPYVGFMHKIAKGHPALVSDLIEEWRAPLIDSMVLAMIKRNMLTRDMFEINEAGCFLNTEARKIFADL